VDYGNRVAFIALVVGQLVAVARYDWEPCLGETEVAFADGIVSYERSDPLEVSVPQG